MNDSVLVVVNSAAASVLFVAGVAKTVSPAQLGRALNALFRTSGKGFTGRHVRVFAAAELLAALSLTAAPARQAGAWAAGVLGVSFALAGVMGMVRGGGTACGCLGAAAGRPLGWVNVLAGALLMAVPAVNRAAGAADPAGTYFFQVGTGLACGALLLCLWAHRGLVKDLTRPLPASR
ncbi:MauE/DoxX family redox-associated membrane protein [Spirillospora sp. CA-142024]|uniref:MauE/DoxX family redox-associated membrane protein n=1 Tax=Spirillospora sp. CA-142024 TaxID=3240036 RepID=UPI003D923DF4